MDEGYIKFKAKWEKSPPLPLRFMKDLNHWRDLLYAKGLIGAYENGIGFGNISQRFGKSRDFIISGSGTGILDNLRAEHYALVTHIDIGQNTLNCSGPVIASSESMSHGVIYRELPSVTGVIHVHNGPLWRKLLHKVPTTSSHAPYGTPEMAYEIIRLLETTNLESEKIFVMEGHEEGIFTFGDTLEDAGNTLLEHYQGL